MRTAVLSVFLIGASVSGWVAFTGTAGQHSALADVAFVACLLGSVVTLVMMIGAWAGTTPSEEGDEASGAEAENDE